MVQDQNHNPHGAYVIKSERCFKDALVETTHVKYFIKYVQFLKLFLKFLSWPDEVCLTIRDGPRKKIVDWAEYGHQDLQYSNTTGPI